MKRFYLLILILLQNVSFAQNQEKQSKNRLIIKFKSSVGVEYRITNNVRKFNNDELEV